MLLQEVDVLGGLTQLDNSKRKVVYENPVGGDYLDGCRVIRTPVIN